MKKKIKDLTYNDFHRICCDYMGKPCSACPLYKYGCKEFEIIDFIGTFSSDDLEEEVEIDE